mgnify:CR=1 FL=1
MPSLNESFLKILVRHVAFVKKCITINYYLQFLNYPYLLLLLQPTVTPGLDGR